MPSSVQLGRRWAALSAGAALLLFAGGAPAAAAAPKKPRSWGSATIVSVDGPARLTLKSDRGTFKVRFWGIDTPEPGECGATETTAALRRLVDRRGSRVR